MATGGGEDARKKQVSLPVMEGGDFLVVADDEQQHQWKTKFNVCTTITAFVCSYERRVWAYGCTSPSKCISNSICVPARVYV